MHQDTRLYLYLYYFFTLFDAHIYHKNNKNVGRRILFYFYYFIFILNFIILYLFYRKVQSYDNIIIQSILINKNDKIDFH